jgi:hypothetical protein
MGKQCRLASGIAALILVFTAGVLPAFSAAQTVFGPEDFTIGRMHLLLSRHSFDVSEPGPGLLRIRDNTPEKKIIKSFGVLNRKLILPGQSRHSKDTVFEKEVPLKGNRGTSVTYLLFDKPSSRMVIYLGGLILIVD